MPRLVGLLVAAAVDTMVAASQTPCATHADCFSAACPETNSTAAFCWTYGGTWPDQVCWGSMPSSGCDGVAAYAPPTDGRGVSCDAGVVSGPCGQPVAWGLQQASPPALSPPPPSPQTPAPVQTPCATHADCFSAACPETNSTAAFCWTYGGTWPDQVCWGSMPSSGCDGVAAYAPPTDGRGVSCDAGVVSGPCGQPAAWGLASPPPATAGVSPPSAVAGQCADYPSALPFAAGLGVGSECSGFISYIWPGGPSVACGATLADIVALANIYTGAAWAPPAQFDAEDGVPVLCPTTCGAQGVQASRCWAMPPAPLSPPAPPAPPAAPPPPPIPPFAPVPSGVHAVATADQIRGRINATAPGGSLALQLPPGVIIPLEGAAIVVGAISLTIASSGAGATLDAGRRSRVFEVQPGAQLQLQSLTLANGASSVDGGTMALSHASVTLSGSAIVGSSAGLSGGAIWVLGGDLTLTGQSTVVNSTATVSGGAMYVSGASVTLTGASTLSSSHAKFGGAFYSTGGNIVILSQSSVVGSTAQDGGAFVVAGGSVYIANGFILRSTAQGTAGAFYLTAGAVILTASGRIAYSTAFGGSGAFLVGSQWASVEVSQGSSIVNSSSPMSGCMTIAGGTVTVTSASSIENSSALFQDAGVFTITAGSFTLAGQSSIVNSFAARDCGVAAIVGGQFIVTNGSAIRYSYTGRSGAVAFISEGILNVTNSSSLLYQTAKQDNGWVFIRGGVVELSGGSTVFNSTATGEGGVLSIIAGSLMIIDSAIMNSTVAGTGGVLSSASGTLLLLNSSLINSTAKSGGAMYIGGGEITISECMIKNSRAEDGGAFWINSGVMTITSNTEITQSVALLRTGAPCIKIDGGDLNVVSSIIESGITSDTSIGVFAHVPGGVTGVGPLLLVTFTEFRALDCGNQALISQLSPAQLVLRSITFTPPAGCSVDALTHGDAFAGITATKGCGAQYVDRQQQTWDVCSSRSPDACVALPVGSSTLLNLTCSCPWPEYDSYDGAFAPYEQVGGCIAPMRLTDLSVILKNVAVALSKPPSFQSTPEQAVPASMLHSINVTLREPAKSFRTPVHCGTAISHRG